jgi:succinyl-CoA synthetase alpha subunit
MSILLDENTPVLVQGITGRSGRFHTRLMLAYGTRIVAGVSPGKGGEQVEGVPVFNTVKEAVKSTGATASVLMVPPQFAADAMMEAADSAIALCAAITDGIPAQDMIRVKRYMRRYRAANSMRLLGPNCAGIISPGKSLLGIMPGQIYTPGVVGMIARSGTLSYEAAAQLQEQEIGLTTSVGIGGDLINGSSFMDILQLFESDDETRAILLVGEIGGSQEAEAADFIRHEASKPVIAYVAGLSAPKGRKMGHAGAIISAFGESANEKVDLLEKSGATIVRSPSQIGETVAQVLSA